MKKLMVSLFCVLLSILLTGSGWCAEPSPPSPPPADETQPGQAAQPTQALQPGPKALRPGCEARFDSLDTNLDGRLTKEELKAIPHRSEIADKIFKNRDANGDGILSKEEFCGVASTKPSARAGGGQGGKPGTVCLNRFKTLDTNGDGLLTRDEFLAIPHSNDRAEQAFKARDLNKDGALTKDEFCSGRRSKLQAQ